MRFVESQGDKTDRLRLNAFGYNAEQHKQLELNQSEIDTIKKAIKICDMADNKLREYYQDIDLQNSFGWASIYLHEIIDDGYSINL